MESIKSWIVASMLLSDVRAVARSGLIFGLCCIGRGRGRISVYLEVFRPGKRC